VDELLQSCLPPPDLYDSLRDWQLDLVSNYRRKCGVSENFEGEEAGQAIPTTG
jgi:hypothetical protein